MQFQGEYLPNKIYGYNIKTRIVIFFFFRNILLVCHTTLIFNVKIMFMRKTNENTFKNYFRAKSKTIHYTTYRI